MDALSRSFSSLSVSGRSPPCGVYLLHLCLAPPGGDSLMVACSDFRLRLLQRPSLRLTQTLGGHGAPVSALATAPPLPHSFFSAALDGGVRLWDVRAPGQTRRPQREFRGAPGHAFSALGVSCDGVLLCGGTETAAAAADGDDGVLVFWDARNEGAPLGVYSESHSDDITQVLFHPTDKDRMASGSTDGLVNVFDLSRGAEEDALIATCNSESSVSSLCWLGPGPAGGGPAGGGPAGGAGSSHSRLLCVAHDEGLKLWDLNSLETEEPLTVYSSRDARHSTADSAVNTSSSSPSSSPPSSSSSSSSSVDFLVGGLWLEEEQQVLVLGGRAGGEGLLFSCDARGLRLLRRLGCGHSEPVRCFGFDPQTRTLFTGGEDGEVLHWSPEGGGGAGGGGEGGEVLHWSPEGGGTGGGGAVVCDSQTSLKSSSVMKLKSRPHNKHKLNRRTTPT